jgi:hypothetical protein
MMLLEREFCIMIIVKLVTIRKIFRYISVAPSMNCIGGYHPKAFADLAAASSNACLGSFKP